MRIIIFGFNNLNYSKESKIITKNLGSLGRHGILDRVVRLGKKFHTHSAIHEGLFNAAIQIGFESVWVDYLPPDFIFKPDDIIITEARFIDQILKVPRFVRVMIHGDPDSLIGDISIRENFWFFENFLASNLYEDYYQVSDLFYAHRKKQIISMAWATDDFSKNSFVSSRTFKPATDTYYIGNFSEDALHYAKNLSKQLRGKGIKLWRVSGVNSSSAKFYSIISRLSFDIRCSAHVDKGFIPCRVFKNISYGRGIITNSMKISDAFNGLIPYFNCPDDFMNVIENYNDGKFDDNFELLMHKVQNDHTYVNRLKDIIRVIL